jgi:DNA helicase-2/ATP-dependent DNA helicase PcrA
MELDVPQEEERRPASARLEPFSREALARELNGPQLEAVIHPPAPLLVVAGAGSGKTRVITYRLARLVATGADPRRILAVTFTNKAAGELRERVRDLLYERMGVGLAGLSVGTFHSISARLLRQYGEAVGLRKDFVIYDTDDQKRLMARVLTDLKVPERMFPVRQVLSAVDRLENQGIPAAGFQPGDYFDDVVAKAYHLFEERMAAANATDFGGLLLHTLRMCVGDTPAAHMLAERFDHVLVDEFQDTNSVQYKLVRCLSHRTKSITVVGDEDQSIYKWRGADIRNILDFERDHAGARVVKLEQNYRSTGHILRAANAIISCNTERRPKRLFTEAGDGARIVLFEGETERDEADFVAGGIAAKLQEGMSPRDFAVFYRTNAQSRVLEDAFRARNLPYVVVGGTRFFDRAEIKDLICYLRAIANPDDGMALQRIINVPARGIGAATVDKISEVIYNGPPAPPAEAPPPARGAQAELPLAQRGARKMTAWGAIEFCATDDSGDSILGAGPRKKVAAFVALMNKLRTEGAGLGPADLAEKALEESGYRDALAAESTMEAEGRMENLLELVGQMREYEKEAEEPSLAGFLERIALASDVDGYDPEKGAVSLMTVHTAKGLEFPVVFITGLEERIFPHARSVDDDSAVEEERRLAYVAVTRARTQLYLSRVRRRRLSGQELPGIPSRFLRELPPEIIDAIVMERPREYGGNYGDAEGQGPWGGRWSRDDVPEYQRDASPASRRPGGRSAPAPSGPRAAPGELSVHYDGDGSSDTSGLHIGDKLKHPQFGVGEVRGWQSSGADMKVTMRFPKAGVKTILARFLTRP